VKSEKEFARQDRSQAQSRPRETLGFETQRMSLRRVLRRPPDLKWSQFSNRLLPLAIFASW
jgi:hypothetical protein